MQTALFKTLPDVDSAGRLTNGLRDPAFASNKAHPLHRWVPWIAGFSCEFVNDCLAKHLSRNRRKEIWVLDPFAGVGTTLVQSFLHGCNVVGFEINPYAALACRLKLQAVSVPVEDFTNHINAFEASMHEQCPENGTSEGQPVSRPPEGFSGRTRMFSPKVEKKVLLALDFINSIEERTIRDLFRLAFGSVMVCFSNYSYEPSLTRRAAVDRPDIEDAPVAQVIAGKLRVMQEDILWVKEQRRGLDPMPKAQVIADSIFKAEEKLDELNEVDLVVTSPPYLNNYHYPRNTRPQLHWLGMTAGPGYKGAREGDSFGKFWQTVRGLEAINLNFSLPCLRDVIEFIRRANCENGEYGGPGWANYVATYFNDAYRLCGLLFKLLRSKGSAVVVLGNSVIQGVEVKTDQFFGQIARLRGLEFADTLLLREKRTGTSIIQSSVRVEKAARQTVLYESAIVLHKK
jgi:DNA modification methylase